MAAAGTLANLARREAVRAAVVAAGGPAALLALLTTQPAPALHEPIATLLAWLAQVFEPKKPAPVAPLHFVRA